MAKGKRNSPRKAKTRAPPQAQPEVSEDEQGVYSGVDQHFENPFSPLPVESTGFLPPQSSGTGVGSMHQASFLQHSQSSGAGVGSMHQAAFLEHLVAVVPKDTQRFDLGGDAVLDKRQLRETFFQLLRAVHSLGSSDANQLLANICDKTGITLYEDIPSVAEDPELAAYATYSRHSLPDAVPATQLSSSMLGLDASLAVWARLYFVTGRSTFTGFENQFFTLLMPCIYTRFIGEDQLDVLTTSVREIGELFTSVPHDVDTHVLAVRQAFAKFESAGGNLGHLLIICSLQPFLA